MKVGLRRSNSVSSRCGAGPIAHPASVGSRVRMRFPGCASPRMSWSHLEQMPLQMAKTGWRQRWRVVLIWLPLLPALDAAAESMTNSVPAREPAAAQQHFGGNSSVGGQLSSDSQPRTPALSVSPIQRYETWLGTQRTNLRDRVGLTLAGNYNALVQGATESLGEDWAAGGVFRITATGSGQELQIK